MVTEYKIEIDSSNMFENASTNYREETLAVVWERRTSSPRLAEMTNMARREALS